jgi:hypothetical protein
VQLRNRFWVSAERGKDNILPCSEENVYAYYFCHPVKLTVNLFNFSIFDLLGIAQRWKGKGAEKKKKKKKNICGAGKELKFDESEQRVDRSIFPG